MADEVTISSTLPEPGTYFRKISFEGARFFGPASFEERDFLVTDLFPAEVTAGKQVLLIYSGDTLDQYKRLQAQKAGLVAAGRYEGRARRDLAREMGALLSYPERSIEDRLSPTGRPGSH